MQCSRQIESVSGEANGATGSSSTEPQYLPTPSADLSIFSSPSPITFQGPLSPDPTVDNRFMVLTGMDTWEAFLCIADILKLACMQDSGFNIGAIIDTLPPPLTPTQQQQIVPHRPYVDMLPHSLLRDRVLKSVTTINETEFVLDMVGFKVWGSTPWDPMGWEFSPDFARKWWFLMDDELMRPTNFWRGQRGEQPLVLAPP